MSAPPIALDALLARAKAPWTQGAADALAKSLEGSAVPLIRSITQDSRTVSDGALFCALRGHAFDGHDHVEAAVDAGAVAALVERHMTNRVPELIVDDARLATGEIAAAFNEFPEVLLVAVTGTNGKTSVVTLLAHIINSGDGSAASMGTLTGALTTAPAPEFHATLREHAEAGHTVVAAEISSHALDQGRIAGSAPAVSIFTNLSQDHLDYHADMDEYFEAKAQLFSDAFLAPAVIDVSDPWGAKLADRLAGSTPRTVVPVDGAGYIADAILDQGGSSFTWRDQMIDLPLGGAFSVTNAVLAAEASLLLGLKAHDIATALSAAPAIPGRFESVDAGQPFAVVIDYSHTPASVEAAVASARRLTDERVLLVFGAAGDRDPGKRPLMGHAARSADVLYVTSDNPRTEDPDQIVDQVLSGIGDEHGRAIEVHRVVDRAEAIRTAISGALPGDVVVIAGKGHEDYQIIGTTRSDFDDRVHARAALAEAGWESAP